MPALVCGGLALVLCCGGIAVVSMSGDDGNTKQASGVVEAEPGIESGKPADQPATDQPAADQPEEDKPAGPATAKVGGTIVISGGLLEGDEMAFTVRSVKAASSDNMFTQPGSGKKYIAVDISVQMRKGDALMTGSEVTLQDKSGEVYNNQFVVHDDAFEWANLSAGQRKSGLVFFEVPKAFAIKGSKVLVQDFWDRKPAGAWTP
ncbi:DUF4352 domain-containing protein [Asanoa iriomotensis]|uniref:DUF4352 domain-containing protein n=1 Tax=Asanoa iriomotensis TaxID=234613 RepID=UPI0019438B7A|nr:DUF4352 domain-containing protein [Asanoa iriomotensis]